MDDSAQPEIDTIWDEAKAYIERGNFEKAIEIYKYILIRYEDDSVAIEYANAYLGDAYLTLRKLNRAENHLKKAISIAPEKADYHYLLGFVYSIDCYWSKAIKEFEIAVMANSDNAEYLRGLGWAYFNNDNRSEGLGYLQKATKLDPSNINILLDLANAHLITRRAEFHGPSPWVNEEAAIWYV